MDEEKMDCTKYKKSPITRVILHISFPQLLGLNENNPPYLFQKTILGEFPYMNIRKGHDLSVDLTPSSPITNVKENVAWEFQSKDKHKFVYVNEKSLQIQLSKYNNFEEFLETIKDVFEKFKEIYPISVFKIGLRYINEVKIENGVNPREWNGLINESLINTEGFITPDDNLIRSMHVLELKQEDYKFRFQFGLFNSNYPNQLVNKEFILDYDCVSINELSKNDLYSTIKNFHDIIKDWFEKSITDELREKLGCNK